MLNGRRWRQDLNQLKPVLLVTTLVTLGNERVEGTKRLTSVGHRIAKFHSESCVGQAM